MNSGGRHTRRNSSEAERVRDVWFLILVLGVGLLLRLDFMRAGNFVIDSDEAIVGLMGKHILEGREIPTFYYGQHYMGSLEPLCVALSFALFGVSSFTLQLVPLAFSLILIYLMYRLGREVGGVTVGRVAALLCAVPPAALLSWSFKARGGFIELLVIGALAFLFTVRWLRSAPSNIRYAILVWLVLGIGWWVNNQIIYFMVPVMIIMGARGLSAVVAREISLRWAAVMAVSAVAAFLVGGLPYWVYNVRNNFPSLGMFTFAKRDDLPLYFEGLWSTALPIILGAKRFWEQTSSFSFSTSFAYSLYGVVFAVVLLSRRQKIVGLFRGDVDSGEPLELFLLLSFAACAIFTVSSFGWLSQAPRYLLPLYVSLFIITGAFVKFVSERSRVVAALAVACVVGLNVASCYAGGRAIPGEPIVFDGERVSRDHTDILRTLDQLNIRYVRTNYWIGYRLAFESGERVLFGVFGDPRQVRIPEYQEPMRKEGSDRVPLLVARKQRESLVRGLLRLGYSFDEASASGYALVYNLRRATQSLQVVPPTAFARVEGSGPQRAESAVDGKLETRWGTGQSQRPGQFFKVLLTKPLPLGALTYRLGAWPHDYPRSLQIDLILPSGETATVLSAEDYRDIAPLLADGDMRFEFSGIPAQGVLFRQLGSHPIVDWSIAEISLFASAQGTESNSEVAR